jgi:hypothetical protein
LPYPSNYFFFQEIFFSKPGQKALTLFSTFVTERLTPIMPGYSFEKIRPAAFAI